MNQNYNTDYSAKTYPVHSQENYARLVWRSRRGMLELDLVFYRFVREAYLQLDVDLQRGYQSLLESEDPYLYKTVILGESCLPQHLTIVSYIRNFALNQLDNTTDEPV